ncbi:hypothetical protein [Streptomyces chartreusis]|uniref:Uncharacterized protein n=1 Tax=Streptomyces chartreusis TaxID=1969 RepID=A0A7H8TH80_STRCX|nr:hypothetical protein [Streptomyces chartreusis]QKZ22869.1 hypothetical protein HUT05_39290 [Streptomyces chartreusis]
MLTSVAVNIIFLAVAVAVCIPKQTRPLVTAVAFVYFVVQAVAAFHSKDTSATPAIVAALAMVANWLVHRKQYINELKG